jgi:hypothetical protein
MKRGEKIGLSANDPIMKEIAAQAERCQAIIMELRFLASQLDPLAAAEFMERITQLEQIWGIGKEGN